MAGNVHQSTESSIPAAEDHHYVASSSSTPSSSWTVVASTVGRAAVGRFWRTCINRHGSGSGPVSINGNNNYWLPVVRMTSASGGGPMTGDGDYWIFVLKLFYGPELEDTWECVFSVPRVTLAFAVEYIITGFEIAEEGGGFEPISVALLSRLVVRVSRESDVILLGLGVTPASSRATGVFFLLGLGGYLSLKVFRWISASKNSLESPRQCRSPISCSSWGSTTGDRLPSGPLDLESVFLHQHHSYQPLLNPRVLPERNTSGRRCHVSPRKTNAKRKDRARQLAAQSSSAKTSPRHMRKFGFGDPCVPAAAAAAANYYSGCSSSDAQQELSFFAMGAVARGKKSMCHQGSAAWDTDSYAADLSDTNHGKTSRSSSCSGRSFTGPHPKHGMKLYRVTSRSQSREWAQMTDLDSSWSSAESTEDFSSPESKGCFLGSLDPVYDSRSRHLMMKRPILKFEEKHRLLCKWHQLPVCAICGVDSSSTTCSPDP
ncbi:unnamed protein product [Notodromas monacha]|uniref:Uncharacterized protein n=1 Tax=Notodromas monacha TaxID=399045 RepID=A0A7R9BWA0_9CRUS|nr:unnamed protein product [Notodromas monacha]CAG0922903.1 unnamed protein product [Notodromas monacha]